MMMSLVLSVWLAFAPVNGCDPGADCRRDDDCICGSCYIEDGETEGYCE